MYSDVDSIIVDAKNGKPFVLVDSPYRENEGDIVIPSEHLTHTILDFMQCKGRGVVCLAIHESIRKALDLDFMPRRGVNSDSTAAFTTSIEAARGIKTGASLHERVLTIKSAIAENASPEDIVTPGHVFPIVSNPGGLANRTGHTEASIEICEIAGLIRSAVLCEIMDDEGLSASSSYIQKFANLYKLNICSIDDLIDYQKTR